MRKQKSQFLPALKDGDSLRDFVEDVTRGYYLKDMHIIRIENGVFFHEENENTTPTKPPSGLISKLGL